MATLSTMAPVLQQSQLPGVGSYMCGSLQFEFDVDDRDNREDILHQQQRLEGLKQRLAFLQQTQNAFSVRLQRDVRRLIRVLGEPVDAVILASRLAVIGYSVCCRTAICPNSASCFRNLRHEFLTIVGEDEYKEATFIVDPRFKEQFQIPQPSAAYVAVLSMLPEEFVGTASRLIPLVQCLCAEMALSFESQGLTLPPWRRAQSMLSKWLPTKSHDISFNRSTNTCASAPAAAAPCACSDCEGASPTGASGGSPFSRISDYAVADMVARQNKSLLSGKLSSTASSTLGRSSSGQAASFARTLSGISNSGSSSSQGGVVSMQPPVYRGQPTLYKVKPQSRR